jgi:hypothetical protein
MGNYVYTVQPPPGVVEEPFVLTSDDDLQPGGLVPSKDNWRIARIVEMPAETRWIDDGEDDVIVGGEDDVIVRRLVETEIAVQKPDDAA